MARKKKAPPKKQAPAKPAPTPVQTGQNPPEPVSYGGGEARKLAMKHLAEGLTLSATARAVGVHRHTVRTWRDSIEGQQELDAARKARADQFADAADQGRRILREAVPLAAQTMVDRLRSKVPFEGVTSADHILSRIGLPRTTKVETSPDDEYDLSKLTDAEHQVLEMLLAKARKEARA